MDQEVTPLTTRDQLLLLTGHHPYAMLNAVGGDALRAYAAGHTVVWFNPTTGGASALGDPATAVRLLARLLHEGGTIDPALDRPPQIRRLHLPRTPASLLAAHLTIGKPDHWDFRWTRQAPPAQPGQERVTRLQAADTPAVRRLLDLAFPAAFSRPGDPRVRQWYGIWAGGELVACGADRSRGGVASLGALAVHPDRRGRGLGAALTAAMATQLLREFPIATLGVMVDNQPARHLYRRLGFTATAERTSVDLVTGA